MTYRASPEHASVNSATSGANGHERQTGAAFATRSEVIAKHGMAATSQPLATQVALDILKDGGNAIDAAIAANAVLGLVEPTGSGIGGDLFAIVWDATNEKLAGLNASGRSPRSLTLEYLQRIKLSEIPKLGVLPVSVPGAVDGWFELHQKFGSQSMTRILAPAIAYAEEGFPVTEVIAAEWAAGGESRRDFPGFAETFLPGGDAPVKGQMFRNPLLAATYEKIASGGRDEFYQGEIARKIDAYMTEHDGFLRYADLEEHRSEWIEPVSSNYHGFDVHELAANTQGIAALQILNILEGFDLAEMGFGSAEYIHTFVEAKKLVYADRANFYADPKFSDIPVDWLISKTYAEERRRLIDPGKAAPMCTPGDAALENGDTVYLTVADQFGNMVSLIQSNFGGMGSGMTPGDLGFCLQNRGALFSLQKGHANVFAPGKRPFHTIIPGFVTKDGRPWMSFGFMGGSIQPLGHAQILINMIDFGMNLQESGDAARIRHTGSSQPTDQIMSNGGVLYLESGIGENVRDRLRGLGHNIAAGPTSYGGYQAIKWDEIERVYYGASESRKDGHAAGY